jgi:hypothetical protein
MAAEAAANPLPNADLRSSLFIAFLLTSRNEPPQKRRAHFVECEWWCEPKGVVAELVGIEGGVVSTRVGGHLAQNDVVRHLSAREAHQRSLKFSCFTRKILLQTKSAQLGHGAMSDLSPLCTPKRMSARGTQRPLDCCLN